jgi:uncharacterized protein (TIGR03085 family)
MSATDLLLAERAALCDTLDAVGPHAATLDEGWDTSDLAAHLLVRETRADAAIGIVLPGPFAHHMANVMEHAKQQGYETMVAKLRTGPPFMHRRGPLAAANVSENWIHHEDVRRAAGEGPRPSDSALDDLFWRWLGLTGRMAARRARGIGITVETPDGRSRQLTSGPETVTLTGAPGELLLFLGGRKEAAKLDASGSPENVALVIAARMGI